MSDAEKQPTLILPVLRDNLESLHKHEVEIRTNSILHINSTPNLKEHLDIVYASLNVIFDVTKAYRCKTDDELTLQYLGIRLFNSVTSTLKLLLSGYYQCSAMIQRDILETGFLLDYFSIDRKKISEWKLCTEEDRRKKFRPVVIRNALDKRDGFTEQKRDLVYQRMCQNASHPSYQGFKLVAPQGLGEIGPFFDPKFLGALVEELALRVPGFTMNYIWLFRNLPAEFQKLQADFLHHLKTWGQKYLDPNFQSDVDTKHLKELAGRIQM